MNENTWPDPARPGVPLNPERDGWHWVETPDGERVPYEWRSAGECERGRWPSYWVSQGEDCWEAPACKYLGPVLTPDEAAEREDVKWHEGYAVGVHDGYAVGVLDVRRDTAFGKPDPHYAALQKRVAELEGALKFYGDVSKYPSPLTGGMGALWSDCGQIARAALEGGKDDV